MARIVAAIACALREDNNHEKVHFHAGSEGPYVCENPRCTSPGLDPHAV